MLIHIYNVLIDKTRFNIPELIVLRLAVIGTSSNNWKDIRATTCMID